MRQRSSLPSDSSSIQVLHPVLQAALDSLDVELEEELTRYRRQRYRQSKHGKHIPSWQPSSEEKQGGGRSPQLPLTDQTSRRLESIVRTLPVEAGDRSTLVDSSAALPPLPNSAVASAVNPSLMAPLWSEHPERITSDKTLDRLRELAVAATSHTQDWSNNSSDLVSDLDSDPAAEASDPEALPRSDFSESPDDYLESTEELLQSIAEEAPPLQVERESSLLNSLLTPLGIGSMVLLLLSSATLGYVIMHPSSLDLLNPSASSDKTASGASATPFASPLIPDSPNLAAEEFVDLNLDNLSTVPGSASPNAAARGGQGRLPLPSPPQTSPAPNPSSEQPIPEQSTAASPSLAIDRAPALTAESPAPEAESTIPEPELPPEPESSSEPASAPEPISAAEPVAAEPSSLPAIDLPAADVAAEVAPDVATAPAVTPAESYYVVTPYNGDPSLEQARQAVPQAYVRNFATGASVQLGVFSDAANAQELVQELQSQGIAAEVYQP